MTLHDVRARPNLFSSHIPSCLPDRISRDGCPSNIVVCPRPRVWWLVVLSAEQRAAEPAYSNQQSDERSVFVLEFLLLISRTHFIQQRFLKHLVVDFTMTEAANKKRDLPCDQGTKEKKQKTKKIKKERKKEKHQDDDNRSLQSRERTSKRQKSVSEPPSLDSGGSFITEAKLKSSKSKSALLRPTALVSVLPPHQYVLAPMVGASELAFRLLTQKYGAQLAYTPMMAAAQFAENPESVEFQTCASDKGLVVHVSANNPTDFAAAVQRASTIPHVVGVDLNLGCPQRTAFLGNYGSYLLDKSDLLCSIVQAGANAVKNNHPSVPIFCKIRLLDTLEDTIALCQRLRDAGASLIAIHARYRANWERKGPGARDGAALLDQVAAIKKVIPEIAIISNGNVITYQDVENNLQSTQADGIMSAEGILDNPALFLERFGTREEHDKLVEVTTTIQQQQPSQEPSKKRRKLMKKLRSIEKAERKKEKGATLDQDEEGKMSQKGKLLSDLKTLDNEEGVSSSSELASTQHITLGALYKQADDRVQLAKEYLSLVKLYPVKIRTVVFHIRRMLKHTLTKYQLLDECLKCDKTEQVANILDKLVQYQNNPQSFVYDREKAQAEKDALERKQKEEGKRKAYEARMKRKAKREGKPLEYYLDLGAAVPSVEKVKRLKKVAREEALEEWKKEHSQHCMSFHLDKEGCKRDRACAFLHADSQGSNAFVESDEVAG
jgi:tRNA-dihydrouridine synthase 1